MSLCVLCSEFCRNIKAVLYALLWRVVKHLRDSSEHCLLVGSSLGEWLLLKQAPSKAFPSRLMSILPRRRRHLRASWHPDVQHPSCFRLDPRLTRARLPFALLCMDSTPKHVHHHHADIVDTAATADTAENADTGDKTQRIVLPSYGDQVSLGSLACICGWHFHKVNKVVWSQQRAKECSLSKYNNSFLSCDSIETENERYKKS